MNWDRVRKESQSQRSGAEWIGSDSVLAPFAEQAERPKKRTKPSLKKPTLKSTRTAVKRGLFRHVISNPMPGCTCNKPVGFDSEHRRTCPLRADGETVAHKSVSDPTVWDFAQCIKNSGQVSHADEFISKLLIAIQTNGSSGSVKQESLRVMLQIFRLCL